MKDFDRAISAFNELIRLESPLTFLGVAARGTAYRRKGDLNQAIADFEEAIQLHTTNEEPEVHGRLGEAYLQKENIDRAIAEFSIAIRNSPSPFVARQYYIWRGKAYLQGSEINKAMADFDFAISIIPSPEAYVGRGETFRKLNQEGQAIADFNRAHYIAREPPHAVIP